MRPAFYLVVKDKEQAERIAAGASVASALSVCETHNEAVQFATEWLEDYPELDIVAQYANGTYQYVTWFNGHDQMPDASGFAGLGG